MATTESRPGSAPHGARTGLRPTTDLKMRPCRAQALCRLRPVPDDAVDAGAPPIHPCRGGPGHHDGRPARRSPHARAADDVHGRTGGAPGPGRRPTTFLLDMTHAMQAAAEQARAATWSISGRGPPTSSRSRTLGCRHGGAPSPRGGRHRRIKVGRRPRIARIREETETASAAGAVSSTTSYPVTRRWSSSTRPIEPDRLVRAEMAAFSTSSSRRRT